MHSRIFQVSSKPISQEDYLTEDDIPESFFNTTADYVDSPVMKNGLPASRI